MIFKKYSFLKYILFHDPFQIFIKFVKYSTKLDCLVTFSCPGLLQKLHVQMFSLSPI